MTSRTSSQENTTGSGPIVPIVIGTAGHIDHGKSTLVQALTGIDPDRLKEEKARGMTIDLGFAPLTLPDGRLVGIVDVPGHERFVRNMVAGATGIDLVVLVVAADDGVMPQTREHLQIMSLLGVERGFVALTKVDAVDADMVDLAEEDVRETLQGTFLEASPILRVSAITGEGVDELRAHLEAEAMATTPRAADGVFRMPVQRVFSKRGFGTVVTGIPVSGEVAVGDVLELLPSGARGKVRGIQAYRQKADRARAGHSTAINLTDVDHGEAHRGFVLAKPNFFQARRMVAARLTAVPGLAWPISNRMPIRLHTGTADVPGEVILLDQETLAPDETGLVQLRLSEPVVCAPGDRFVLRLLSPVITLGGGVILEESRHRLKRFKEFVLTELTRQEASLESPLALLESLLDRHGEELVATDELAVELKRPKEEVRELLGRLAGDGRAVSPKAERWIHVDRLESARLALRRALEDHFAAHPHRTRVDVRDLRAATGTEPAFLSMLLAREEQDGLVETLPGGLVRVQGREAELDDTTRALAGRVDEQLVSAQCQPPTVDDLAGTLGAQPPAVQRALEHLVDTGRADRIGADVFASRDVLDRIRAAIVANCERHGQLEIPELRNELQTTRKYLIPLLEYFDAQGLTTRQGGYRILKPR
jgi:selenocysteine-specific elongation factor